ncbi:MAG: TolC family protein [Bacteroidales bacterium]|nr:TolC family protein [Bacteroidales bacterium]
MKIHSVIFSVAFSTIAASAQMSLDDCMQYAATHNSKVEQSRIELNSYENNKMYAIGQMLPSIDGYVGAQCNFGRAIDPETNTYTNVNTFNSGYQLSAALTVFDGMRRIHEISAAKAAVLMGRNAMHKAQDNAALNAMQSFADVLFYREMVAMADARRAESETLLKKTQTLHEIGQKSYADVIQMQAQLASNEYELMLNRNKLETAMMELKLEMNFPLDDSLDIADYNIDVQDIMLSSGDFDIANVNLEESRYAREQARQNMKAARSAFCPRISVEAGINTMYFRSMDGADNIGFARQMRNNVGEYIGASVSIPIFNRLGNIASIRRTRNDYRIADEQYRQRCNELRKMSIQADADCNAFRQQVEQMQKTVDADSLAHVLIKRKYEEGLCNPIDLQASAAKLASSRATLLQSKLMFMIKNRLSAYYKGEKLWIE